MGALKSLAILLTVFFLLAPISYASPQYAASAYSADELDQMLAPIALYPDPLLAQLLPAASFGDQISQAQSMLGGRVDEGLIEGQPWDISVKALAHYPGVLQMLSQNPDWVAALGQAYVMQRADVERSIQRLRFQAQRAGILRSNSEQEVIVAPDYIQIEPAQPQVIYVPQYDPGVLEGYYADNYPNDAISYGSGFAIGAWLNRDWDWYGAGPYYHAWKGGGWIGASRRFINPRNHHYVNDQFRNVHVDRRVIDRHVDRTRAGIAGNVAARRKPESPRQPGAPPAAATRPARPPQGAPQTAPAPAAPPTAPGAVTPAAAPHPATPPPVAPHATTPPPPAPHPATPPATAPHPATPPPAAPRTTTPPPPAPHPVTPPPAPHRATPPPAAPQATTPPPPTPHPVTPPPAPHPATPPPAAPQATTPPPPVPHPVMPPAAAPHPAAPPPPPPAAPHAATPPPPVPAPPPHAMAPPPAAPPPAPHPAPPPPAAGSPHH